MSRKINKYLQKQTILNITIFQIHKIDAFMKQYTRYIFLLFFRNF